MDLNTYNLSIWFYKKKHKNYSHTMCLNTNQSSICVNNWNEYTKFMLLDLQRNAQNINGCMIWNVFNLSHFIVEEEN